MKSTIPLSLETLRWARETANLDVEDVAQKMNKDPNIIQGWESGELSPTYVQLEKLAYTIYKRPLALFFFPEPPKEITPRNSFRTLPESEFEEFSPYFLRLFRKAQSFQIKIKELSEESDITSRKVLQDLKFKSLEDLKRITRTVRNILGVSLQEQIAWTNENIAFENWRAKLEAVGVHVFKDAFRQHDISGFCLYDEEFPVIYVNNSMPKTRQIFTIFHELAHLLFKTGGIDKTDTIFLKRVHGDNRKIEVACNRFVGEFLVPKEDFDRRIISRKLSDKFIEDLASTYKVSREVILRRCLDKGLVSQDLYERKSREWIGQALERRSSASGGDYYRNVVSYLSGKYLKLAFKSYLENKISATQLADYLGVKATSLPGIETEFLGRG
jgi:Zn-dependent peptidase ImmA (M78 family)